MVCYKCLRCGYTSNHKPNFINHLNRKNICEPILEDISIENIKIHYNLKHTKNLNPIEPKLNPFEPKMNPTIEPKLNPNEPKLNPNLGSPSLHFAKTSKYICMYCNKSYSTNSHMRRHEKNCRKKRITEHDQEIEKMKLEIEHLKSKSTIHNNLTHNTTHHTTNNITHNNNSKNVFIVNNYGNENKDYITHDYLINLLKKPFQAIPELIKFTHFNHEHPENQNIKIPNKKQPYVKIRKNDKWELVDRKETINDLIDQKHSELNDCELINLIDKNFNYYELNRIERFNQKYMNDDKDFVSQLYKDTELVIINNS